MSDKLTPVSLEHIVDCHRSLAHAEALRCTCSSFELQYNQGCQCERSKYIASAHRCLQNLLNRATKEFYLG